MKKFLAFILLIGGILLAGKYYLERQHSATTSDSASTVDTSEKNEENQQKAPLGSFVVLDRDEPTDGVHLYNHKKFQKAIAQLQKEYDAPDATARDRSLAYIAKCYEMLGQPQQANEIWQKLLHEFPKSRYSGDASYFLANHKKREGMLKSAEELLLAAAEKPESVGGGQASLELARLYKKDKVRQLDVWRLYSQVIRFVEDPEAFSEALEELTKITNELVYSSRSIPGSESYTVRSGDNLTKIAKKYNTSVGFIKKINGKNNDLLRVGERLKVISGKLHIEVRKNLFFLGIFLDNGLLVKGYQVGLGRDDRTPVRTFRIETKLHKPDWWRNGRRIPYGDPDNLLGEYWLGFENDENNRGFGIHGTKDPDSIGKNRSDGCIRLRNADLAELFLMIPRQTEVVVRQW